MGKPIVRFAPSPNGYLHLGHAYSALMNQAFAQACDGRFLLRIEDIDIGRARPDFEQAIYEDLRWLGIAWEEPVRRQSEHMADYRKALGALEAMELLYPCFCTRQEIRAAAAIQGSGSDPDGAPLYPGTCRMMDDAHRASLRASGKPFALRLDSSKALQRVGAPVVWSEFGEGDRGATREFVLTRWGDVVLGRKDIGVSYHIAVTVDDWLQGVSDVIRGEDLYASTAIHRLLQELLGYPSPNYRHHYLFRDGDENKLSKSKGDVSLKSMRAAGATAQDIIARIGMTGG